MNVLEVGQEKASKIGHRGGNWRPGARAGHPGWWKLL